jgi:hypothetical protein
MEKNVYFVPPINFPIGNNFNVSVLNVEAAVELFPFATTPLGLG